MLPVDKVIGKLYPIFGAALSIMMALGLLGALLVSRHTGDDHHNSISSDRHAFAG